MGWRGGGIPIRGPTRAILQLRPLPPPSKEGHLKFRPNEVFWLSASDFAQEKPSSEASSRTGGKGQHINMCASSQSNGAVDTSMLESFEHDDVEGVVNAIFGSCAFQSRPRRFAMEDIVKVDHKSMSLLQASSLWKGSVPHIERVVEKERLLSAEKSDFVARTFRQRPSVVYAVR